MVALSAVIADGTAYVTLLSVPDVSSVLLPMVMFDATGATLKYPLLAVPVPACGVNLVAPLYS